LICDRVGGLEDAMDRRDFLRVVGTVGAAGAVSLGAADPAHPKAGPPEPADRDARGYSYRIAFGAWINDMRQEPLPLENWPAPQLDDASLEGAIRAMDVQAAAGFQLLDVWGLFATYGWPRDIASALTDDRRRRIETLLAAARERDMGLSLGLGTYSWGYDRIIAEDPEV